MIAVLLLLGILIGLILGAAGAAAVIKPNRERAARRTEGDLG